MREADSHRYELAGMTATDTGRFEQVVPYGERYVPPSIELVDGWLHWKIGPWLKPDNEDRTLTDFIRLADAPDEAILKYARRYGILGICEHEVPATHAPRSTPFDGRNSGCRPIGFPDDCREPLDIWRRYAREAWAILSIAAELHQGRHGHISDWETLFAPKPVPIGIVDGTLELRAEGFWLEQFITERWIYIANPILRMSWGNGSPKIHLTGWTLFEALTLQLVRTVARTKDFAFCTHCGELYEPRRKPRQGQRHFCETCKAEGVPELLASRDRYARQKRQ